jgi:hypothetical protein
MFHRKYLARKVRMTTPSDSETSMESMVRSVGFPSGRQNLLKS